MRTTCVIYYFSATGNSLAVALELAGKLDAPDPVSIPGTLILDDPYAAARAADQVGFVFPVHRASLPEMVRGFIERMPKRADCYYFAVSTYTIFGYNEFWDIDQLLGVENCWLNYAKGIKTMGSVGPFDPSSKRVEKRLRQMSWQIDEVAEAVGNFQESTFRRSSKVLGKMVKAFTDIRRRTIVFRVNKSCNKCGICAQVCPAQNITMPGGEQSSHAPIRSNKCEACFACLHWCPSRSIETTRKIHSHYHHPHIKPEQLNPVQSLLQAAKANKAVQEVHDG